jgi:hypothetical protein
MTRRSHAVTPPTIPASSERIILGCFGAGPTAGVIEAACARIGPVTRVEHRLDVIPVSLGAAPALVLVPLVDPHGMPSSPLVARLRDANITVGVLVHALESARGLAYTLQLGAQLLTWSTPDNIVAQIALLVRQSPISDEERQALVDTLGVLDPLPLRTLLTECTARAHQQLSVALLAEISGVSSRTLNRLTHRFAWPPPAELIAWGRALRVSLARWHGAEAPASLARSGGFASVGAMTTTISDRLAICDDLRALTPLRVRRALQRRLLAGDTRESRR